MRRLLLILGIVCMLAVPAAARAATTVQSFPFDLDTTACNGDRVLMAGELKLVISETTTPSGASVFGAHIITPGIAGIDLTTGAVVRATGTSGGVTVLTPPGGSVETSVMRFGYHIEGVAGAQQTSLTGVLHLTMTPKGSVTASFDKFSATC